MLLSKSLLLPLLAACTAAVEISVASSGGNVTTNTQYGLMEEEINHCGEGGLYAELIRNRAFQGSSVFPSNLDAWVPVNGATLSLKNLSDPLSSALPTSVNVKGSKGLAGLTNLGWWGIDVKPQKYTGSFYVKGTYSGSFTASLQSATTGKVFASAKIASRSVKDEWVQHDFILVPHSAAPDTNNTFSLTFDSSKAEGGALDFNLISLFPPTWNNRPNGLRRDLMQAMKDFGPKFLRFPGGNNLEGNTIPTRWKWNETIGPLKDRPGRPTTWGYEETGGMGLVEYMEWCDDLGLEPILAVWSGMALNHDVIPEDEIHLYVQDAMNELEFLMGSVDTTYGAWRAKVGHPEPWVIKYVEIGNEDNLNPIGKSSYESYRFKAFYDAIKAKYPDITVLASYVGMSLPDGAGGDYHTYDIPDNFVHNFGMFDNYSEKNPILLGEIAVVTYNGRTINWADREFSIYPFWIGSVAEAVFLLGAERNANKIVGTTYAPMLTNMDNYEWSPTFMSFNSDPAQTTRSTSWHVYDLFAHSHMTNTLPTKSSDNYGPLYHVAGVDQTTSSHIFKAAVYNSTADVPVSLTFDGVKAGTPAELTVLTAPNPLAMNEVGGPNVVNSKVTNLRAGKNGVFNFSLPNLSVAVLKTTGKK